MVSDLIEDHPKAVALSLLTLLLAGGVAGGLWIHNLKATIAGKDAALAEGIERTVDLRESLEARHKEEVALLKQENAYLSEQVKILRRTANHLSIALARITTVLNEASSESAAGSSSYKPELARAVAELERQSDDMSRAIREIDVNRPPAGEPSAAAVDMESPPATDRRGSPPAGGWVALAAVALAQLLFAAYLYRHHRELETRELRLRQARERPARPPAPPRPRDLPAAGS